MKSLITRTLTGSIFVAIVVASILLGHITFSVLFLIITIIGLHEFYAALENKSVFVQNKWGIIVGGICFAIVSIVSILNDHFRFLFFLFPLIASVFVVELYRKKENSFSNIAFTVLGIIYIAIPFSLLNFLLNPYLENGFYTPYVVLGIFIITWVNDTFAYLVGVTIGKNRLFERHSPHKSWEGFFGGVLFSIVAAFILYKFIPAYLNLADWIVFAIIISVVGTLGDLVESMFKRGMDIKDSGTLLPGHGGILDRFDGILIAIPCLFCYLAIIKNFF